MATRNSNTTLADHRKKLERIQACARGIGGIHRTLDYATLQACCDPGETLFPDFWNLYTQGGLVEALGVLVDEINYDIEDLIKKAGEVDHG